MSEQQNEVVTLLRGFAKKLASAPDRMTTADGQGGLTTMSAQPQMDAAEGDIKQDLPVDGVTRKSTPKGGAPDRLNTPDGQGGMTTAKAQPTKDDGEDDLKQDLPTDGTTRKSARVDAIRAAIIGANPALAPAAPAAADAQKQAGNGVAQPIELSQDLLAKIASEVLATEDGINFVYSMREKAAGAAAAHAELTSAIQAAEYYDQLDQVKSAAFHDVFSKAAAIHDELAQLITEDDADEILKTAAIHQAALFECGDNELLKVAYVSGMEDAALLDAAQAAEEGGEEVEGELPMSAEEGLGEEEVLALLAELIESGELTEEEVMQAIAESEGGEEGAEGMPSDMEGAPDGPVSPMG
jgi:hypothetical protein